MKYSLKPQRKEDCFEKCISFLIVDITPNALYINVGNQHYIPNMCTYSFILIILFE